MLSLKVARQREKGNFIHPELMFPPYLFSENIPSLSGYFLILSDLQLELSMTPKLVWPNQSTLKIQCNLRWDWMLEIKIVLFRMGVSINTSSRQTDPLIASFRIGYSLKTLIEIPCFNIDKEFVNFPDEVCGFGWWMDRAAGNKVQFSEICILWKDFGNIWYLEKM